MLKSSAAFLLGALVTTSAFAQSTNTTGTAKTNTKALASQGQKIATSGAPNGVTACVTCHGASGEGIAGAGFPRLAGQSQYYLNRQLTMFASGARNNPIMSPIAKAMNKQQMEATAAYYAGLVAPQSQPATPSPAASLIDRGRILSESGDESRQVQACANCHGPGGSGGVFTFPYLAGQHQDFLQASMAAWKSGARNTDPSQQMPSIAHRLTDEDIAAVSAYYAAQQPPPPQDSRKNVPAGSPSKPVPPPVRSGKTGGGTGGSQGIGTEQGSPTTGGNQGPGGGGGTQVSPQGPLPKK